MEKKAAQTPPATRQENHIILARVLAGSRLRLLIISLTESTEQLSRGWKNHGKAYKTHYKHIINQQKTNVMAQISGKVICILPVVSGENERGEWQRGGVVIETLESPSVKLALSTFGKRRTEQIQHLTLSEVIVVTYAPESREFMGKWYTELRLTEVLTTAKQPNKNPAENE